jgi:hypothetical protein
MIGDPAVGDEIAGRDALDGIQRLVTKHTRSIAGRVRARRSWFAGQRSSFSSRPSQLLLGPVQLGLERAERKLQRIGQVLVLHPVEVVRGDQQAVVRRQPGDGLFQPVAQFEIAELPIRDGRAGQRVRSSSSDTARRPSRGLDAAHWRQCG